LTLRAVLLDSFGTLVEMEPPGPHLRDELAARGVEVSPEAADAAFRAEIAYYLEHHVEGRDRASLDELRDRCATVIGNALGLSAADVREAMLASIRFSAAPNAARVLRELRARGLRLVVASNWDCSLGEVLQQTGLRDLVDAVVTSAEVGAAKPDPRLFEAALAAAGAVADEAIYVGDSPGTDRADSLRTLILGDDITSLAELPTLLFG
jgi:HAD superfamily hydrolase (TIGR01509 family)